MEFHNEELGVKFTVPDRPTVFQQMAYQGSYLLMRFENIYWRNWVSALLLVGDWECETIPEPSMVFKERIAPDEAEGGIYLDEETSPTLAAIMMYVGNSVMIHVANLEDIPKN